MKSLPLKPTVVRFFFLILIGVAATFAFGAQVHAASIWRAEPALCPQTDAQYPGVNCFPEYICGDSGGVPQCYNTVPLTPPAGSVNSSTIYDGVLGGGYIVDCAATVDAGAPYCDNNSAFWCNSDVSCYTAQHRQTTCAANLWSNDPGAFACGACRGGYGDCDLGGDDCEIQYGVTPWLGGTNSNYKTCIAPQCNSTWFDCNPGADGSQCTTQNGSACALGGLTGAWSCVTGAGSCSDGTSAAACTCVVPKSNFQTGTDAQYSTTDPLLWGTQYGTGDLFNLSKDVGGVETEIFQVNNDGTVQITATAAPGVTTDKLYNVGGALFWNGTAVGSDQDFEGVFATDADKVLDTSGATFTIDSTIGAAGDLVVTSTDWSVDATGSANFAGTLTGGTVTDGTFSVTGGAVTGATGNISMWTNDSGYLTLGTLPAETDPTFGAWLAVPPNVSTFTNDSGYLTVEADPTFTAWLAVPPNVSTFTNDSGYITAAGVPAAETDPAFTAWLAVPPNVSAFANDAGYTVPGDFVGWDTNAADDFDGSYASLTGKPANIDEDSTNDVVTDGSSTIAAGNTFAVNGVVDFSSSTEFHLREDVDPATNATCTTIGELILDTTDKEIQICTAIGSPGTWASTAGITALPVFVGLTAGTYDGDLAGGGTGYNEANTICDAEGGALTDSHMCTTDEIVYSIVQGSASWPADGTTAWIVNGPPGYTSNSNDCSGWTNSSGTGYYGPFWEFTAATGGKGWMAPCNVSKKIACCK